MNVHEGDRVLVNVAPFIASARWQRSSVPCEVLKVDGGRLLISTQSPYRQVDMWVEDCWIEKVFERRRVVSATSPV